MIVAGEQTEREQVDQLINNFVLSVQEPEKCGLVRSKICWICFSLKLSKIVIL